MLRSRLHEQADSGSFAEGRLWAVCHMPAHIFVSPRLSDPLFSSRVYLCLHARLPMFQSTSPSGSSGSLGMCERCVCLCVCVYAGCGCGVGRLSDDKDQRSARRCFANPSYSAPKLAAFVPQQYDFKAPLTQFATVRYIKIDECKEHLCTRAECAGSLASALF